MPISIFIFSSTSDFGILIILLYFFRICCSSFVITGANSNVIVCNEFVGIVDVDGSINCDVRFLFSIVKFSSFIILLLIII